MICELCCKEINPPPNRPDWKRCWICTANPPRIGMATMGPAPAFALPRATAERVVFIVPGRPLSVNRVYRTGQGRYYYTDEGKRYKASVAGHARSALGIVHWDQSRRYRLSLTSYFSNARADSDNPLKVVKDALQGTLWTNDNQVISDHTEKALDKISPRLVVTVEAVDN